MQMQSEDEQNFEFITYPRMSSNMLYSIWNFTKTSVKHKHTNND